jgi:hypothetical protein
VCGDSWIDLDGPDNSAPQVLDNEECDDGMYCSSGSLAGVNCTFNPLICPGVCMPVTNDSCTQICKLPSCGDNYVDRDGLDDDIDTHTDNETCDDGNVLP